MVDFNLSAEKLFFICVCPKLDSNLEVVKVLEIDEKNIESYRSNPFSFISSYIIELAEIGYKVNSIYRGFKF